MFEGVTHLRARWRGRSLSVLAVLWTACNADQTGPELDLPAGVDLRPQFYTTGGVEGSLQLGIPPDNNPPAGGAVGWTTVVTASKYDFVRITVSGTVTSSLSGQCPGAWGRTGTFDPWGHSSGELRVHAKMSVTGGVPQNAYGSDPMIFARGVTESSPVTFSVRRSGVSGDLCNPWPTPALSLSGSQTVAYEVYPFFEVSASPGVVASGDTVTFGASSHWQTTSGWWRYRENDTTATPLGAGSGIAMCNDQTTCEYAPAKSGRMYRLGTFPAPSTTEYGMPGPIVWVGSAPAFTLQLSSSAQGDTVTRGDSVTLTVRNTGAGGELNHVELAWRFEPDSVPYYPESVVKFAPPPVYDTLDADSIWAGRIVHPGKIIVSGVSGSNTHADTIVVSVTDRSWGPPSLMIHQDSIQTAPPAIPIPSDSTWTAGEFHTLGGGFGHYSYTPTGVSTAIVSNGPNEGYAYVESATYTMHRSYSFNPWIINPGDLYDGGLTTWEYVEQQEGDPQLFFNKTLQHEVGAVSNSHAGRQEIAAGAFEACGHLTRAVERLVGADGSELVDWIGQATLLAEDALWYLSDHAYVDGFQSSPNPVAEWNSSRPGIRNDLGDDAIVTYMAPDTVFCKTSGV